MQAYRENLANAVTLVLEASPVGDAVRQFVAPRTHWEGTASELLPLLTALMPEAVSREKSWPKQTNHLTNKLRRVAPALRRIGIHVVFDRTPGERKIFIECRAEDTGKSPSSSSSSSYADPRKGNGARSDDGYDGHDDELHLSSGPVSDEDAVSEELAARAAAQEK
jgi:hypothetical protein